MMIITLLVVLPLVFAAVAAAIPSNQRRPLVLPVAGVVQLLVALAALRVDPGRAGGPLRALEGWLLLDALGRYVLATIAVLAVTCLTYAASYLRIRGDRPNRTFCISVLCMVSMLSLATLSNHLGVLWVAVEGSALASAPLIYFGQSPRAVEATWKFLLVGSVGVALALLGSFFLAYSALHSGLQTTLVFNELVELAPRLSKPWLHAALVTLVIGYGTKMGLAPMHTWKPDAYGEAPGVVGALMAGGPPCVAYMAMARFVSIANSAGEAEFLRPLLLTLGLLSMAVAAVFVLRQRDVKRMLAWSSVEHMGILVLGLGIGGGAVVASLFHMMGNAFVKCVLFLSAGNIHRAYRSKSMTDLSGVFRRLPASGTCFTLGFLAATGLPLFAPFLSEFMLLREALRNGHSIVATLYVSLLLLVFVGMGRTVFSVMQGEPGPAASSTTYRDRWYMLAPIVALLLILFVLGTLLPAPVEALLADAHRFVVGGGVK